MIIKYVFCLQNKLMKQIEKKLISENKESRNQSINVKEYKTKT